MAVQEHGTNHPGRPATMSERGVSFSLAWRVWTAVIISKGLSVFLYPQPLLVTGLVEHKHCLTNFICIFILLEIGQRLDKMSFVWFAEAWSLLIENFVIDGASRRETIERLFACLAACSLA